MDCHSNWQWLVRLSSNKENKQHKLLTSNNRHQLHKGKQCCLSATDKSLYPVNNIHTKSNSVENFITDYYIQIFNKFIHLMCVVGIHFGQDTFINHRTPFTFYIFYFSFFYFSFPFLTSFPFLWCLNYFNSHPFYLYSHFLFFTSHFSF